MSEICQGINFSDVLDLTPWDCGVIVRRGAYPWCNKFIMDERSFASFKFNAIKWIRKRPAPDDRCWRFEILDQFGIWSLAKQDRLLESRKTLMEKNIEKKEDDELRALFKKYGLDYDY